jgi:hypothetical protein
MLVGAVFAFVRQERHAIVPSLLLPNTLLAEKLIQLEKLARLAGFVPELLSPLEQDLDAVDERLLHGV